HPCRHRSLCGRRALRLDSAEWAAERGRVCVGVQGSGCSTATLPQAGHHSPRRQAREHPPAARTPQLPRQACRLWGGRCVQA
ncbi:unnamed protein product, partial [Closterium sp. NIES-53]